MLISSVVILVSMVKFGTSSPFPILIGIVTVIRLDHKELLFSFKISLEISVDEAIMVPATLGLMIGQDVWQRVFTAKNCKVAKQGTIVAGIYIILWAGAMTLASVLKYHWKSV